jgi:regulator of nonsense transcripts 2
LFLERIPKAYNHHCNLVAVGPQKSQNEDEVPAKDDHAKSDFLPSDDIDTIISLILKLPWKEQEEFIFR